MNKMSFENIKNMKDRYRSIPKDKKHETNVV